jgi:mRNA-degrading endonuclease RelE of RelBE toxin-antitoxin system
MQKYLKFVLGLPSKLKIKVFAALALIEADNLEKLDCKKLRGLKSVFRVRVGSVRIIFEKVNGKNKTIDIGFKGDTTYKKLR